MKKDLRFMAIVMGMMMAVIGITSQLNAQAPQAFRYQTVVRDSDGTILAGQNVTFRMSILQGELPGTVVYSEIHSATANDFGLVNLEIGRGTPVSGSFETIDWGLTPYFMKTEMDPLGGEAYIEMGNSELLSVPFSLFSQSSYNNYWNKLGSSVFYNEGYVGIGTSNPDTWLDVRGSNPDDGGILKLANADDSHSLTLFSGRENDPFPFLLWKDSDPLRFCTDRFGWSEKMRIGSDGKVGIGNSDPAGKLDVVGDDSVRVIFSAAEGANNRTSGIMMRSTFGGDIPDYGPRNLALIKAHFDGGAWGNAALSFNIAGDDCMTDGNTDPCERMRITGLGNLGIGTSSPENRLHVAAESDPLRLEGLQATTTLNTYLVADENGVVYKRSGGGAGAASWELTGNSGTSASDNFIGTTDNVPLTIKVNNQISGKIDQVLNNSSLGYASLLSNTTGYNNSALGHLALNKNTSGYENTAIGKSALYNNTLGYYNSAVGRSALHSNTTGYSNNAFGVYSMFANTTGFENVAVGLASLYYNTTGSYNTVSGHASMYFNTTGSDNTASGYSSLYANTSGNTNSAYGSWAMRNNTTGFSNVAVGASALFNNTVKSNLVAIGDSALYNNGSGATSDIHGTNNVAIGSKALFSNTTGSYNVANGPNTLNCNTTGSWNTALGGYSLSSNISGNSNTGIGMWALASNKYGNDNIGIGHGALVDDISGSNNVGVGNYALRSNISGGGNVAIGISALYNSLGDQNTGVGCGALQSSTTGNLNTAMGYQSSFANVTGKYNTSVGHGSLHSNTSGNSNIAIGCESLFFNTTKSNLVAIGDSALYNNGLGATQPVHGARNMAIGSKALFSNTTGYWNTALGYNALYSNTSGYSNVAVGLYSLKSNSDGYGNTAFGLCSANNNTTGDLNTSVGYYSFFNNIDGNGNTAMGGWSLYENTSGHANTACGEYALWKNNSGDENTAIGHNALNYNSSGGKNVAIGNNAGYWETGSNKLYIDNQQRSSLEEAKLKALIYGEFATSTTDQNLSLNANVFVRRKLTALEDMDITGIAKVIGTNIVQGTMNVIGVSNTYGNIYVYDPAGNEIVVAIGTGLDYAEGFDVSETGSIEPGTVLCIDPANQGKLKISKDAYDFRVAGIVAGAKGLGSGVKLGSEQFDQDVALAGRVYCNVIATDQDIVPGDLLTTSDVPGFAMKVNDFDKARGAILGKAMENLEQGKKGQILVLVTLQ